MGTFLFCGMGIRNLLIPTDGTNVAYWSNTEGVFLDKRSSMVEYPAEEEGVVPT